MQNIPLAASIWPVCLLELISCASTLFKKKKIDLSFLGGRDQVLKEKESSAGGGWVFTCVIFCGSACPEHQSLGICVKGRADGAPAPTCLLPGPPDKLAKNERTPATTSCSFMFL